MNLTYIINRWIIRWLELFCAIVGICTFSFYRPIWDFDYMFKSYEKDLKKRIENEKPNNK